MFTLTIFPDAIAGPAIQSLAERSHATPYRGGTAADLKASMLEGGIDKSVLLHIVTKPKQFANVHRFALAVAEDNPEFISFGSFHPDSEHWRDEIRQIARDGLKGIKLHPDYQNFYVDEERLYPMYEAIFEENLILVFHAGLDIGYPDIHHCTPSGFCVFPLISRARPSFSPIWADISIRRMSSVISPGRLSIWMPPTV
ncbi:MAG: amidohydrolase family protein [Clostridia bacterium]